MIVVVDDEDRENEGDLTLAAEFVTPEAINFMAKVWSWSYLPDSDGRTRRSPLPWTDDANEYLSLRYGIYREHRSKGGSDYGHLRV